MARHLVRDCIAIVAALSAPLAVTAVLIELRTFGNSQSYGRFMLKARPGSTPSRQARVVAVTRPVMPDARSVPARPRGACPDGPASRPKAAAGCLMASPGGWTARRYRTGWIHPAAPGTR